jgi:hypothetical protein
VAGSAAPAACAAWSTSTSTGRASTPASASRVAASSRVAAEPLSSAAAAWAIRAGSRRRKAAAKCHLRLNIGTFLPAYAVVEDPIHQSDRRRIVGLVEQAGRSAGGALAIGIFVIHLADAGGLQRHPLHLIVDAANLGDLHALESHLAMNAIRNAHRNS